LPFGTRARHRLILHGGGGTFFDFVPHDPLHRAANALMLAGGTEAFIRIEAALRRIAGRPRLSARTRLGLGIGIGTFTPGSPKLREVLPVLNDFDALWLRDAESVVNLSRLGIAQPVVRGSDLAFLWDHWCPPGLALAPPPARPARPRVGVILRDWPVGSGAAFAQRILPMLERLSASFELTLISLDPSTDAGTLSALPALPQIKWAPDRMDIHAFVEMLAAQDVLLTARAHGAICGVCVGRPSVILEVEPKLRAVHAMLPGATRIVSPPYDPEIVVARLEEALAIPFDRITADALRNRAESERALAVVLERLNP
jgi:polysaccharide pyruvyl transferase WcaK-like protein